MFILQPPLPHDEAGQYEATVARSITRQGGETNTNDMHTNIGCAAAHQSPSLVTLAMALVLSDNDEICAWSWRSSHMTRLSKGGAMIYNWTSFNVWVLVDQELLDVGATECIS